MINILAQVLPFLFVLCVMLIIYLIASKRRDERFDEKWQRIEERRAEHNRRVKLIGKSQKRKGGGEVS